MIVQLLLVANITITLLMAKNSVSGRSIVTFASAIIGAFSIANARRLSIIAAADTMLSGLVSFSAFIVAALGEIVEAYDYERSPSLAFVVVAL